MSDIKEIKGADVQDLLIRAREIRTECEDQLAQLWETVDQGIKRLSVGQSIDDQKKDLLLMTVDHSIIHDREKKKHVSLPTTFPGEFSLDDVKWLKTADKRADDKELPPAKEEKNPGADNTNGDSSSDDSSVDAKAHSTAPPHDANEAKGGKGQSEAKVLFFKRLSDGNVTDDDIFRYELEASDEHKQKREQLQTYWEKKTSENDGGAVKGFLRTRIARYLGYETWKKLAKEMSNKHKHNDVSGDVYKTWREHHTGAPEGPNTKLPIAGYIEWLKNIHLDSWDFNVSGASREADWRGIMKLAKQYAEKEDVNAAHLQDLIDTPADDSLASRVLKVLEDAVFDDDDDVMTELRKDNPDVPRVAISLDAVFKDDDSMSKE